MAVSRILEIKDIGKTYQKTNQGSRWGVSWKLGRGRLSSGLLRCVGHVRAEISLTLEKLGLKGQFVGELRTFFDLVEVVKKIVGGLE